MKANPEYEAVLLHRTDARPDAVAVSDWNKRFRRIEETVRNLHERSKAAVEAQPPRALAASQF